MSDARIGVVVGSLRRESYNRRVADALAALAPQSMSLQRLEIGDLPLYDQDDDAQPADSVVRLKSAITGCDGIIFVTPEYNRSMPGVLKNALDHASRPYGQSAWAGKPAGVLGTSPGAPGTSMAQQHLRNVLAYLDMPTMGQPEIFLQYKDELFDSAGKPQPPVAKLLTDWLQRYSAWVAQHRTRR